MPVTKGPPDGPAQETVSDQEDGGTVSGPEGREPARAEDPPPEPERNAERGPEAPSPAERAPGAPTDVPEATAYARADAPDDAPDAEAAPEQRPVGEDGAQLADAPVPVGRPTPTPRPAPPEGHLLWASDLRYAHRGSPALLGVSLDLREGEIVSVTGARGSGKSTLLRCLAGLLVPQSGEVWFEGVPVHTLPTAARERLRRDRFGWIGSEPQLVPELTAWENAVLPLLLRGTRHRVARRIAREWLERLEVEECAECRPADLVQSQRQRIALARALVHSPALLFADEPTAPLHQSDRAQVLRTLTAAARSHRITVVLATHRPAESAAEVRAGAVSTDRVISLHDGRRVDGDTVPEAEESAACSLSV